jgi:preprotein translocase subunit SecF
MIRFVEKKAIFFIISGILFLVSLVLLFTIGLKPNIEFTGGSLLEFSFSGTRPGVSEIQEVLKPLNLGEIVVQPVNQDAQSIKTRFINEEEHQTILRIIREKFGSGADETTRGVIEKRVETIGPAVSSYLKARSFKAAIAVILVVIAFIAYSFRKVSRPVSSWKFGIAAVIGIVHDVVITMGVFVLLGHYFGVEVGISFVVAMLTILGYSVNDRIVVYDRVREKLIRRGSERFEETVDLAINETLTRSLITSVIVLLVLFALFFFGGESIKYFALALIVGVFLGAYSSVFIAAPLLVTFNNWKK